MDVKKRVKVYQLDNDGKWEDKGTGHISFITYNGLQYLLVKSEVDSSTILESKILSEEPYQKQQDSLIVWTDPQTSIELALSFQDPQGCQEIWDGIETYQCSHCDLPPVSLENLERIQDLLDSMVLDQKEKDKIANSVTKEYIEQLLDLFEECEKTGDKPNLYLFFHIFKNLILFNDTSIFESLLSEEYIIRVLGALEYDPEISEQNRIKHREFLNRHVIFKTVGLDSKQLIGTIHQTFRIQYLKDVVLPRILDDATFSSLNSIIYFNNIDIVTQIQNDSSFLQQLFSKVQQNNNNNNNNNPTERTDYLLFLQELCNLAKGLQIQNKISFFSTLKSFDLFKTLSSVLICDQSVQNRLASTDIILSTLLHDPSILRRYISEDPSNHRFLSQLITLFIVDKDIGVKNQIVEILKILLDVDVLNDTSDFFKLFYEKGIFELVSPLECIETGQPRIPGDPSSNLESFVLYNVIELIIYCIKHHLFRIKNFIIQENISKKILRLSDSTEKYLVLGSIRYFRSLVSMKDDIYNKHIIAENLFDVVVEILKQNIYKNNLLNSAVIELFHFIYKENIKELIVYLVERYRELFDSIAYSDVPKHLIMKYEQIKDQQQQQQQSPEVLCNNSNLKLNNVYQKAQKEFENEEDEAYFNDDYDDEINSDDQPTNISTSDEKDSIEDNQQNNNNNNNNKFNVDKDVAIQQLQQLHHHQRSDTPIPILAKLVDYDDEEEKVKEIEKVKENENESEDQHNKINNNNIHTPDQITTKQNGKDIDHDNNNNNSNSIKHSPQPDKKRKFEDDDQIEDDDQLSSSGEGTFKKHQNGKEEKIEIPDQQYSQNSNSGSDSENSGDELHKKKRLKLIFSDSDSSNGQDSSNNSSSSSPSNNSTPKQTEELIADI
ncbi:EVH1 domain-containing protein [Tieghemostelium lacteum]|uniref:EVH1 domain-containing protein n=1 Tax=Tieghemostelium lacteum TaxID=361077 RepID=A0A151Z7A7_TIELA|nr:EVH1 domain-containing protein [Tieghemostelium lacteum]|eukprot:KYQ89817.1 EVH1 domain-containing protein [Tieghemostelium lacteum]